MANLEPIEEKDLDLINKFGKEKLPRVGERKPSENLENVVAPEARIEKIEKIAEKESFYEKLLKRVKNDSHPAIEKDIPLDATAIAQHENVEKKIDELIKIAILKGVFHAIKVARHLDDNYSLDELHDRLLGEELCDSLIKKGMIKKL